MTKDSRAPEAISSRDRLRTPRSAAIAGIVFSLLLMMSLTLISLSVPADLSEAANWLDNPALSFRIYIALNMIPFAGIAFLWFMGVIRDRIGNLEDKFFATVFLGSGLLFVAMLFTTAAVAGGILTTFAGKADYQPSQELLHFSREVTYAILYIFAMKMAGVFMISTATIAHRTAAIPRWLVFLGYAFAVILLLSITYVEWMALLFPLWVLMLSVYILIENYRFIHRS
ncbi:MAG: hypothetical protein MUO26_07985 [Methanotrichaceae archaeon]|nr:hypothetical protein [Methanotrichaceae archaeon]